MSAQKLFRLVSLSPERLQGWDVAIAFQQRGARAGKSQCIGIQ
jgi:hypothetical protein